MGFKHIGLNLNTDLRLIKIAMQYRLAQKI